MTAYYSEWDPYCCEWLKNLIKEGLIPDGIVDDRDIREVQPRDLAGFSQCHFFSGLGGWPYAARLAGWPDDRPLWTGSCPCQPFSVAGKKQGFQDERDLWPEFHRLIRQRRPPLVVGEQVHSKDGKLWLDRALAQLEGDDYACWAAIAPACGVEAPHLRYRLWFVADAQRFASSEQNRHAAERGWTRDPEQAWLGGGISRRTLAHPAVQQVGSARQPWQPRDVGDADGDLGRFGDEQPAGEQSEFESYSEGRLRDREVGVAQSDADFPRLQGQDLLPEHRGERAAGPAGMGSWAGAEWLYSESEGLWRRAQPGISLLASGVSGRVAVRRPDGGEHWYSRLGAIKALGNAIVPQLGAEILSAILDMES